MYGSLVKTAKVFNSDWEGKDSGEHLRKHHRAWLWCTYEQFLGHMAEWYSPAGVPVIDGDETSYTEFKLRRLNENAVTNSICSAACNPCYTGITETSD